MIAGRMASKPFPEAGHPLLVPAFTQASENLQGLLTVLIGEAQRAQQHSKESNIINSASYGGEI